MKKMRWIRDVQRSCFYIDEKAIMGLPMRVTVSLIIGSVALAAILSYILNPCLFPTRMVVSVTPLVHTIGEETSINITVSVIDSNGHPINDATIRIKGLGGGGINITNASGISVVSLNVSLEKGQYEGYLDIMVKAACHESFVQDDMIKIIRAS
ncbi:MAG: hypothetical protein JW771_05720 [Candidatus Thermoplasmatota archaeon]|nr:hypothetical protein [Candidatus Thermoplasmatota archaeon]